VVFQEKIMPPGRSSSPVRPGYTGNIRLLERKCGGFYGSTHRRGQAMTRPAGGATGYAEALPDHRPPAAKTLQVQVDGDDGFGFPAAPDDPARQVIPGPHLPGQGGVIHRGRRTPQGFMPPGSFSARKD